MVHLFDGPANLFIFFIKNCSYFEEQQGICFHLSSDTGAETKKDKKETFQRILLSFKMISFRKASCKVLEKAT